VTWRQVRRRRWRRQLLPADELDLRVGALADRESRHRFPPSWERTQG
jgi:hypothetical protein